ncbi:MAG: HAD family hydrolase [Candidatus Kapaibacterium sp.]|jgi:HAD superfamily hydrolase (TIGR01549 family)
MIFFDIDHTLFDYERSLGAALSHLHKEFGEETVYSEAELPIVWESLFERYWKPFSRGELTYTELRLFQMRELFGQNLSESEAARRAAIYVEAYEANWCLFADVIPTLKALSTEHKGIISNGTGVQQRRKLEKTGILDHFEVVVISQEVGAWKPEVEIFEHAARVANRTKAECYHVGDNLAHDIHGALGAGFRPIWIDRSNTQNHSPDSRFASVKSLAELVQLFR